MVHRIETGYLPEFVDPAGDSLLRRMQSDLGMLSAKSVRVLDVYTIDAELSDAELARVGAELLCDPINQCFSVDKPLFLPPKFTLAIAVSFCPGVKDNVGGTARGAIEEMLGRKLQGAVYTSKHYLVAGKLARQEGERLARELLANELIQRFEVKAAQEFGTAGFAAEVPRAGATGGGNVAQIDLGVPDKRLIEISRERLLALSLEEMRRIKAYYADPAVAEERRKAGLSQMPTDVELEMLGQTWSEHCKHKIFNAKITLKTGRKRKVVDSIFKTYIKAATGRLASRKKWLLSVFSDGAGIFEFVPGWSVAMKVETHNSPSALDPYGGALTGILGVNRDVISAGLGARPIFNTDVFCFADPHYAGEVPPRLFHPRRVLEGVRAGVAAGGNASGIPTINGSLYFDDRYLGKPLVYCGTGGIMPSELRDGRKTHEKRIMNGDRIFMVGGRIGKDGIHGATFSSQELNEESPVSAVQLGDPYTQKKMLDFLLEARDLGLYNFTQDCGAGGISSSIGEMAESSGGCTVHLDRAPLKYPGLDPWEIFVSESQERMTLAVPPGKAGEFVSLARLRDVEVSDLGEFNSSGFLRVLYGARLVAFISMQFLHKGVPQLQLEAELRTPKLPGLVPAEHQNLGGILLSLLSRPNICSKEYIIRQYDHEVQGSSVIKPLCGVLADGPSDAGVVAPLLGRREGLVVSNGICARYSDIDAYQMAANAVDEAVRNYVSAGGSLERLALLDNFCWCDPVYSPDNPDGRHRLAQLVLACQGIYDACMAYGAPLISGKDSMKNDYKHGKWRISVPPTLLISAIGKTDDVSLSQTTDFKSPGDAIYVLGSTLPEMGASEYYAMGNAVGTGVPCVDFRKNFALYRKLEQAIKLGTLSSCHDCSEGGLAVALSECCIGGRLGAVVAFPQGKYAGKLTPTQLLFSESAGRFVVSVKKKNEKALRAIMRGVACERIGEVKGELLLISVRGQEAVAVPVDGLASAWKRTMGW
ncbi:MAG: AIR synthase-related protein [Candidatus Micrarchaeota archaeon]|nr:AIR synthase-related protein [Candidatus Micrarchaeota archaeon]